MTEQKKIREMTGAELASMLKSSIHFKSLGGLREPGLKLTEAQLAWWRDARFGMFIHWGLYSLLGRGEWVRFNEQIPDETYTALADQFHPQHFDAHEWAALARDGGMKYMVFTTRHHDGFALWDSPGSWGGFHAMHSAARRDFVKEYAEACRAAGLRTGFYYSPMDWRIPGYFHPEDMPESAQELKAQCDAQVEELMQHYGPVDILWYDGAWLAHKGGDVSAAWLWEPVKLNRMVRSYWPDVVINPRSGWEGDFYCDEGSHEITGGIVPVPWEKNMCVASGQSWGWMPEDPVTSLHDMITMMVNVFTRDGNLLLNVSPDGDGRIPEAQAQRVREIGVWMREHGESIYGTRGGPMPPVDRVYGTTWKENRIYVHVLDTEAFRNELLPPVSQKVVYAGILHSEKIHFHQSPAGISLVIPEALRSPHDTIVELWLDGPVTPPEKDIIAFTGR